MSDPAIHSATFRGLQDAAGAEFVAELVGAFLDEAPRMTNALVAALAARDADAFRRTAHSLKSNAATFGALRLAAQARDMELGAPGVVAAGDARALDALLAELARVARELAELKDG